MLQDIFKTSIWNIKLDFNLPNLNKEIEEIIKKDKGRKISNTCGYQSNDIEYKKYTQLLFLSEIITLNTQNYRKSLGLDQNFKFDNMWININKYKDFNMSHIHPACSIAGVFYVKCPEGCGDIVLENGCADSIEHTWEESINKYTLNTSSKWTIRAADNLLLLFPSYLTHYVGPNLSNQERISLSFNIK